MKQTIKLAAKSKTIVAATKGLSTITLGSIILIIQQLSHGDWVGAGLGLLNILTTIFTGVKVVKNRLATENEDNIKLNDR